MTQRQRQALNRPALAIFNNWNSITPDQKSSFAQLSFGEFWASLVKYLKKMMTLSYFFAAAAFVVTCNLSWRLWKENNNVHAPTHTCTHIQHKQPHTRSHTTTHTHTHTHTHMLTNTRTNWSNIWLTDSAIYRWLRFSAGTCSAETMELFLTCWEKNSSYYVCSLP